MDFNFDEIINRKGTHAIKWNSGQDGVLPMWVADMDFRTAPVVIEALQKRLDHGIFGYTETPPEFYNAIVNWWTRRHDFTLQTAWIVPTIGVLPSLSAAVRALTQAGEKVVVQPPVYNHFYHTIANCGRTLVENKLAYTDGRYQIDFDDLDQKTADPEVRLLIISNPHNPVGRVWSKNELQQIGDICIKNQVTVISDEIHSDLVYAGSRHFPFASLGEMYSKQSITLASPSKTFNLAGLQVGYVFTENAEFRNGIKKVLSSQEMELLSPFAIEALISAYHGGDIWLEALKSYLFANYLHLKTYFSEHLPAVKVAPLEATYLVWLDFSFLSKPALEISEALLEKHQLWVNPGDMYGEAGAGFIRINIACPRALLDEGLQKIRTYIDQEMV